MCVRCACADRILNENPNGNQNYLSSHVRLIIPVYIFCVIHEYKE